MTHGDEGYAAPALEIVCSFTPSLRFLYPCQYSWCHQT